MVAGGRREAQDLPLPLARPEAGLPTGSGSKDWSCSVAALQGCHFGRQEWEEACPRRQEEAFKPLKTYSAGKCFVLCQSQERAVLRKGFFCSLGWGRSHFLLLESPDQEVFKRALRRPWGEDPDFLSRSQKSTESPKGLRTPKRSLLLKFQRLYSVVPQFLCY